MATHFQAALGQSASRCIGTTEDNEATLVFADDGVGFIESGDSKRQGLGLVRRLMQQVGGSATLNSQHGSEWTLKFPVPMAGLNEAVG